MDERVISVMQPYLFPYIGYFQLLHISDVFVFYDDVTFIKQGWINRNRIMVNGNSNTFVVPVQKVSSYRDIRETLIHQALYVRWRQKFFKTVIQSYSKAPYFNQVMPLLKTVFTEPAPSSIAELAQNSILATCEYLNISTPIKISSNNYPNTKHLNRSARLIQMAHQEGCSKYVNTKNGSSLYSHSDFSSAGIDLKFIQYSNLSDVNSTNPDSLLSIIHLMMHSDVQAIRTELDNYSLT